MWRSLNKYLLRTFNLLVLLRGLLPIFPSHAPTNVMQFFLLLLSSPRMSQRYSNTLSLRWWKEKKYYGMGRKRRLKWNEISRRDAMRKLNFVVDSNLASSAPHVFWLVQIINKTGSEHEQEQTPGVFDLPLDEMERDGAIFPSPFHRRRKFRSGHVVAAKTLIHKISA